MEPREGKHMKKASDLWKQIEENRKSKEEEEIAVQMNQVEETIDKMFKTDTFFMVVEGLNICTLKKEVRKELEDNGWIIGTDGRDNITLSASALK